jgi:hypothetical protein
VCGRARYQYSNWVVSSADTHIKTDLHVNFNRQNVVYSITA